MAGRSKNECNGREAQGRKKRSNRQILFHLLLEAMSVFRVLKCTKTWVCKPWLKNYKE